MCIQNKLSLLWTIFICGLCILAFYQYYNVGIENIPKGINAQEVEEKYLALTFKTQTATENTISYSDEIFKSAIAHKRKNKTFTILIWNKMFGWKFPSGNQAFQSCSYSNCAFYLERKYFNQSDAVIINYCILNRRSVKRIPEHRIPLQKWIFATQESPVTNNPTRHVKNVSDFSAMFNATLTYRLSADINFPYGYYTSLSVTKEPIKNVAKNKTKLIAWFVSNCGVKSLRDAYTKELQKYIPVHIYGKCGQYSCPRFQKEINGFDPCQLMLERDYKFYLSFENSLCKDYITEKVWNMLQLNIVPIVLGGANYSRFLPPHSYIDVRNFSSPGELAKYLYILDKNDQLYEEYFAWKQHYRIERTDFTCALCAYMNVHENTSSVVKGPIWDPVKDCYNPAIYYWNSFNFTG